MADQPKGPRIVLVEEQPGRWGWRLYGDNGGDIIATDGNQRYNNQGEAEAMARKIISGHYAKVPAVRLIRVS